MANLFSKVIDFRINKEPVSSLWQIGDSQALGTLTWDKKRPTIKLFFETELRNDEELFKLNPILKAAKPPNQPSIVGQTPNFGILTLENCFQFNHQQTHDFHKNKTLHTLSLMPTMIWMGADKSIIAENISHASAYDTRLVGFFGNINLTEVRKYSEDHKNIFSQLNNPSSIWTFYPPTTSDIVLDGTDFSMSLGSDVTEGYSATKGITAASLTKIQINSKTNRSIDDYLDISWKIGQIFTVFSLEHFRFQVIVLHTGSPQEIAVAWRLGHEDDIFEPPMRHQILLNLADDTIMRKVCSQWFKPSPIVDLSRWLFCKAVEEADDGLSRFISVAQSLEVLGRERGPQPKITKSEFKKATQLVKCALEKEFDPDFVGRIVGLIQSSNKSSFRDVLRYMIEKSAIAVLKTAEFDASEIAKLVSDTRNSVIHMSDSNKQSLSDAFSNVNKLSLQLSFWYAIIQAHILNVETQDVGQFLFNNRNARHGLPNEVLERASSQG